MGIAYTDFILSRQAMQCSPATLEFYKYTAGKFLKWVEQQGCTHPEEVQARQVRQYLAELVGRGKSDTKVHDNARANLRYAQGGKKTLACLERR